LIKEINHNGSDAMIPPKVCRGIAVAALFSFLIPPMLLITYLTFFGAFGHGISGILEYPSYWLPVGAFGFALLTCIWVPHSNPARIAITVMNVLILSFCIILDLGLLLGFTHMHF
jgi:hypothetical protein